MSTKIRRRYQRKTARRAELRFAVIGGLLASPPDPGELGRALDLLATQRWRDPSTGGWHRFGKSTIERWYYKARSTPSPIGVLTTKTRRDKGGTALSTDIIDEWRKLYDKYSYWSVQLLYDNFVTWALHESKPPLEKIPSYSTLRRFSAQNGLVRLRKPICREDGTPLPTSIRAEARRQGIEVRSYEAEYVGGLWHLDFHVGTRAVLLEDGSWVTPVILAVLDDHSRLVCHAQWYFAEDTENLVHGVIQAIQKRGLCRALMSDNGSAMKSEEFTEGLKRLSIQHELTLEYSPYQNGKQEKFWSQIEGRLLPMLQDVQPMTLNLLNELTLTWLEGEYHRAFHEEIKTTPIDRFCNGKSVLRNSPSSDHLRSAFVCEISRRQRISDGTLSLDGIRFEVPSAYRHHKKLWIHYASWDLSRVFLVDPKNGNPLAQILPLDKLKNSSGKRAVHLPVAARSHPSVEDLMGQLPPQMRQLLREQRRSHMPSAYVPQNPKPNEIQPEPQGE